MLSLESAEKYFTTVLDFIIERPPRFHEMRLEKPERYMEPLGFAIVNFILYETIVVGTLKIISQYWDLQYVTQYPLRNPEALDFQTILAATGAGTIFVFLLMALWLKLGSIVVKRQANLKDIIIGICYGTALNGVIVALLGLAIFLALGTGQSLEREQANDVGKGFYAVYQAINLILFPYFLSSAAVLTKISFWRLLTGIVLVPLIFVGLLFVIIFTIALLAK